MLAGSANILHLTTLGPIPRLIPNFFIPELISDIHGDTPKYDLSSLQIMASDGEANGIEEMVDICDMIIQACIITSALHLRCLHFRMSHCSRYLRLERSLETR